MLLLDREINMERQRDKKTGRFLSTHGHRHDKIYKIWLGEK